MCIYMCMMATGMDMCIDVWIDMCIDMVHACVQRACQKLCLRWCIYMYPVLETALEPGRNLHSPQKNSTLARRTDHHWYTHKGRWKSSKRLVCLYTHLLARRSDNLLENLYKAVSKNMMPDHLDVCMCVHGCMLAYVRGVCVRACVRACKIGMNLCKYGAVNLLQCLVR